MNKHHTTQFTVDHIIQTVFGTTYVGQARVAGLRLPGIFGGEARTSSTGSATPIPLRMAKQLLIRSGMAPRDAQKIERLVEDVMAEHMFDIYHRVKAPDVAEPVTLKHVDWSPRHFLGVKVQKPMIDLSAEPAMLVLLKDKVRIALEESTTLHPSVFAGSTAEHSVLAAR